MEAISKPRSVLSSCGWSYGPAGRDVQLRPGMPSWPFEGKSELLAAEAKRRPVVVRRRAWSRPEVRDLTFSV